MIGTIITTENTPVRRIGIEWHLIINTAFTIFLPESDILNDSLFSLWLLLWMFLVWYYLVTVFIQVSPIVIQLGLLLLKDVFGQILYFSAAS